MNELQVIDKKQKNIESIKKAHWMALSKNSRIAYQKDNDIFFEFIKKNPSEIEPSDILKFIKHLKEEGLRPTTINRKIASLSKFFSVMIAAGEISKNPVSVLRDIKPIHTKVNREVKVSLSIDDIRKATKYDSTDEFHIKRCCVIIKVLAHTGMRISELIGIERKDIEVYDKNHYRARVLGKGNKERFVFISTDLMQEINALWKDKEDLSLFYSKKKSPYFRQSLWRLINRRFKDTCGIDVHPHTLRHFFITYKISIEKQDIYAVSRYVGHADVSTTLSMYVDTSLEIKDSGIDI